MPKFMWTLLILGGIGGGLFGSPRAQALEAIESTLFSHLADHPKVRKAVSQLEASLWSSPEFDRGLEQLLAKSLRDQVVQKRIEPVLNQVFSDPACRAKALHVAGDARGAEEVGRRVAIYFAKITNSPTYFNAFSSGPSKALNELHGQAEVRMALAKFRDRVFSDLRFEKSLAALMKKLSVDPRGKALFARLVKQPAVLNMLGRGRIGTVPDASVEKIIRLIEKTGKHFRQDKRVAQAVLKTLEQPEQLVALRDFLRMFFADTKGQQALFLFYRTLFLSPDDEVNLGKAVNHLFSVPLMRSGMASATEHLLTQPALAKAVAASLADLLANPELNKLLRDGLLDYLEAAVAAIDAKIK
ncbi:MAG: hypothetical protein JRF33_20365 [Deltaproteobacteria bacterium]|nr:hypothetical protein [Deltaproteobacteria bacterium]